ncbi:RNA 2',3'-cyclic phosphodiesterase [Bdellovibrio sp. 22V]|uniref:RNA 2',3'-cyclic phosphodiesterase n=1 Tax=Bdellovibrio TaxID=958 RepID=UPI002542CE78|nr:RNA 2',3'-cyclic phosphodiesterase [Bdellovibrio sp. 22V]WII72938.1 RNA 2',3'-cyclic phosphodiesterase [Bdellovibrio sp. 22V]
MNKRLFFALNATDPLSETFLPTYKKLKINADRRDMTVKWVPPDNFHITLTFLGERPEEEIPAIMQALENVCTQFAPFDLKVDDVGAFSNEHDARVLWLGVQKKRRLAELKVLLDQTLIERQLLLQPDEREFSPHLTFARLRNPRSVKDMISPFKRKSFGKIHIDEVVLYESKLQGVFPVYTPILRCKLTGEEKTLEEEPSHLFY